MANIFEAGPTVVDKKRVASGGRALNVTALGDNTIAAQANAYAAVDKVIFEAGFCRRDIGWRQVKRESETAA